MDTTIDLSQYTGAQDLPDSRDFTDEEVLGESGAGTLPERVILDIAPWLNQGAIGACTVFWSSMWYNETFAQVSREKYFQPYDPWIVWAEAKKKGASDTTGWIFQSALQLLKDMKLIGAYLKITVNTPERLKRSLANGKGIATGVRFADWNEVVRTGELNDTTKEGGHIFAILGYDDNHTFSDGYKGGFYVPNSWAGTGSFWIRYKDIGRLFSKYEFLLTTDLQKFVEAQKNRRTVNLQKAFDHKIWNESNPKQLATALEIAVMVNRALWHPDDYKIARGAIAWVLSDKILRGKDVLIWNNSRPTDQATDIEIALMFTRSVMRNQWIGDLVLSREQIAEVIGRDFL